MTDNFPPTNDIPPTGNSYGHYDEHYAALTLSVYVAELVKRGRKCADDLCADGLEDPAWALVHLADAVTAQAAKIAELGRERDDAKAEVRRIHREKCELFDARVAATAHAERLVAALKPFADRVFNDNGDISVFDTYVLTRKQFIAAYFAWRDSAALSPAPSLEANARPAMIDDERAVLERLALGDAITFSQDGDTAWFVNGDMEMVGECIISMRKNGLIERRSDDEENYRGLGDLDVISDAGRALLAAPSAGGDDGK